MHQGLNTSIRLRHHRTIWALLWPLRWYFTRFPIHRGKGLLLRRVILPLLPPKPASFAYRLGGGETVQLYYREELLYVSVSNS